MRVKGILSDYEQIPEFLEMKDKNGKIQTLCFTEADVEDPNFITEEASFLGEIETLNEEVSETAYIYNNIKEILDDYGNNIFYEKIEFIDDKGTVTAEAKESEDNPMDKSWVFTASWDPEREYVDAVNKDIKEVEKIEPSKGYVYPTFEELEELCESPSSAEKYEQYKAKEKQREQDKDIER